MVLNFKAEKRTKYLLIAGALLLILALVYRLFPYISSLSVKEETILKERQLAKYRELIQEKSLLEEKFLSLKKADEQLQSGVFIRETPALAAADIQKILNDITSESGISMKTVRVLTPEISSLQKYNSIPVEFTVACNIRQLKNLLYRIDISPMYLRVSKIQINAAEGDRDEEIYANLTVCGIMKKENK